MLSWEMCKVARKWVLSYPWFKMLFSSKVNVMEFPRGKLRVLHGKCRRTSRERRACRDIGTGEEMQEECTSPKSDQFLWGSRCKQNYKKILLYISAVKTISAILPKDRWLYYLGSNARKAVADQVILSTEYVTKRQITLQELFLSLRSSHQRFCWDQDLTAGPHTLTESPFSLEALLTIRKCAGGIPKATGAAQETKITAFESRIFHSPWEQELVAIKSHDRYMESVGSSYSAAFLGNHLPPDLTQTITLSLSCHQWTGWAEPLSPLVFVQNPLC